jgi:uncharacterized protein (DUF1800 family)
MPARRIPAPADRHLLNRFSYGITPALTGECRRAGGGLAWFEAQLNPSSISDTAADPLRDWFPALGWTPQKVWEEAKAKRYSAWEVGIDLQRWSLLRRVYSRRQVHEQMTEVWSNLLHIPSPVQGVFPHRANYDATIRQHALGRFDQMLEACTLHPAMGLFLDNCQSTKDDLNENLGREVLELHTVGGGYSETDVRDSARILTGWFVDHKYPPDVRYVAANHYTGPVKVMGFTRANGDADGQALSKAYLAFLARHPNTAMRIAHRLCVRFVSDTPSAAIVEAVAAAYSSHDTDIKATLRALVTHPDFGSDVGGKVRTPTEDGVATARAIGVRAGRPSTALDFGNAFAWQVQSMGQAAFDWPRPDGFPDTNDAWCGVTRILSSWQVHWSLAGGYAPSSGATYRSVEEWLPPLPARFSAVVDDLSRRVLARPASAALQRAASAFTGVAPTTVIRTAADIPKFRMTKLVSIVLDTPTHMSR